MTVKELDNLSEYLTELANSGDHPRGMQDALREAAMVVKSMGAIDKILWGKLDHRPNAPYLSVWIDDSGEVCVDDEDYNPSKYYGSGKTFFDAITAIEDAGKGDYQ